MIGAVAEVDCGNVLKDGRKEKKGTKWDKTNQEHLRTQNPRDGKWQVKRKKRKLLACKEYCKRS